jgi:glycerol dehydrogenase
LPTVFADIGLRNPDKEYLMRAAEKACEKGSQIYHEVGMITPAKVLEALIKADSMGIARKI